MRDLLLARPESKWRWLPLGIAPCAFAAWNFRMDPDNREMWVMIALALSILAVGSAGWLGYFGAYARAKAEHLVNQRDRVATHAGLALAFKVIGCLTIAACVLSLVWPVPAWSWIPSDAAGVVQSSLFVGFPVAVAGWAHPWDLRVVEQSRPGP